METVYLSFAGLAAHMRKEELLFVTSQSSATPVLNDDEACDALSH